ncbi:MAG: hypothetical protein IT334_04135 [Thermomicrobiales bacterium]|nr:hypothetical protein [Thermomicrobiales bacterium]
MSSSPKMCAITGASWLDEVRFANQLLRQGVSVLWVQSGIDDPADPPAGTYVVAESPGIAAQAQPAGIDLVAIDPTHSFVALPLRPIRIGLYGGGGAPFNHAGVFGGAGFATRFISDAQIRAGELDTVDVLVMPGGGTRAMYGQLEPLGIAGARMLAEWVRHGGMYIGSCAGAYDCAIAPPTFTASCPPKGELQLINARVWNDGGGLGGEIEGLQSPGVGVFRARNTSPSHPVMLGMPESFDMVHYNGPVFETPEASEIEGASLAVGLAAFTSATERFTPGEYFLGEPRSDEPTLLERAAAEGRYSAVAGELGVGRTVAFGSHPEFGFDLAMNEWGAPARMLVNAALWQAASSGAPKRAWSYRDVAGPVSMPRGSSTALVQRHADQLRADVATLRARPVDEPRPAWLASAYSMSVFGLTPDEIWRQSLNDIETLAGELIDSAGRLNDRIGTLGESAAAQEAVAQIDRWILDQRAAGWQQDGGYHGIAALLSTAHEMMQAAVAQWQIELGPPAGPYDYIFENPYHLVGGSYLAAVGYVSGAIQLMRALTMEATLVDNITA